MKLIKTVFIGMLILLAASLYAEDNGDTKKEDLDTKKEVSDTKKEVSDKKKDDSRKPATLFGSSDVNLSGYGAPYVSFSKFGDKAGVFVGGRGGLIINDSFVIGAGGMGLTYPRKRENITGITYEEGRPYVNVGYGGGLLEYHILPKKLFHVAVGVLVGGGNLSLQRDSDDDDEDVDDEDNNNYGDSGRNDRFFVVEPEVYLYVNVTRFLRLGIGASYRFVNGVNTEEYDDKELRGPTASIVAAFGWF